MAQRDGLVTPHLDAEHAVGEGCRTPFTAVLRESARFGCIIRHVDAVNVRDMVWVPV